MTDVDGKPIVLFVCRHDACRSQIAAGLMRAQYGEQFFVWSGGVEPAATVDPAAAAALAEQGIDITDQWPCTVNDDDLDRATVIVTLTDDLDLPRHSGVRHELWALPGPADDGFALNQLIDELRGRIDQLAATL